MKIDRHNYEEYFILYMDKELGSEERRMVEAFVQQHPDLKEELDNLLQYKLTPDTGIVFEGKEELLKEDGHSHITGNNYEEWFSLYIDNELTAEHQLLVEQFITATPSAKKELELLQQTKLQPESIVFAHKRSLYRREEKVRRIFPFRWRAAAAVLILALGTSAVLLLNKKPSGDNPGVAATKPDQQTKPTENKAPVQPEMNNSNAVASELKNSPGTAPFVAEVKDQPIVPVKKNDNNKAVAVTNQKTIAPQNKITDNTPAVTRKEDPVIADINNKPSNNLPQPLNNPNTVINKTDNAVAINKPIEESNPTSTVITPPVTDVTNKAAQPSNIVQASYNGNNDDAIFDQSDGKKNKNRGIFRKIARTFEKRTNMDPIDDNKLLVVGLAIKLK
jgi:anti-sigma factor RsiW